MEKSIRQPPSLRVDNEGKPNKMNATYREMAKLRTLYPNKEIDVLKKLIICFSTCLL